MNVVVGNGFLLRCATIGIRDANDESRGVLRAGANTAYPPEVIGLAGDLCEVRDALVRAENRQPTPEWAHSQQSGWNSSIRNLGIHEFPVF